MSAQTEVPNEQFPPLLVNRETAADLLSISLRSLDYLISNGKLSTKKLGRRTLIPYGSLAEFAGSKS
jgi:excisionase family DNA binding protein